MKMSKVEITYEGDEAYTALDTKNEERLSIDCPMQRGECFGPDSLVAAGLGACMLIRCAGSVGEKEEQAPQDDWGM